MSELLCEECGKLARYIISRRTNIYDLSTDTDVDHPLDPYERGLMTDVLCEECYKEAGYEGI